MRYARAAAVSWAVAWLLALLVWPRVIPAGEHEHAKALLLLFALCLAFAGAIGLRSQFWRRVANPAVALVALAAATIIVFL